MFVSKVKGKKGFTGAKVVEDINEDNLEELFSDDRVVYRMVEVDKDSALEEQKRKLIDDLRKQQEKINKELAKLSGVDVDNPAPVAAPTPQVQFLSEQEKNQAQPEFSSNNVTPVNFKPLSKSKPINPTTGKEYTKDEFMNAYGEFKELAERKEQVVDVYATESHITVNLTEDIRIANDHRGIPLKKNFV